MGNTTRKATSLGLTATLLATLGVAIVAVPALASTSVTSAGSVLPGSTSVGTASFTLTENSVNGFPNTSGTLIVTITDSAGASTVHFSGTPLLSAPGSLGAAVALGPAATSFVVTTLGADNGNVEPITVSGLRISADGGAAAGPIKAAMSGSLVAGILSPTTTASGIVETFVGSPMTAGVIVNVSSPCGFAATGGLNTNVTFSDVLDARPITGATALAAGQQTLTIGAGAAAHVVGTTITQTVADCLGTNLGSPGTVGSGGLAQTLTFALQPGGGAPGAIWLQQPVVDVLNASSLVVTTDNSTVVSLAIATNPVGGTLSCTSGLSRTVVNGVATFFGCSINLGSSSSYTLSATSSPAWTPATSSAFLIGTAPAFGFNLTGTALGNTLTGPFTPGTKISHGGYITWRFDGGAAVAGQTIQIWAYKKTALFTNPWSAVYLLTTRVANASGVAYANITSHNVIWLSIRPVLPASGSTPAVWGPWSIGRWVH